MTWNNIVILICVLLAAFGVYREYQRASKSHLAWRLVATVVSIIALACVVLPVGYRGNATQTIGAGKILLTAGFNADNLTAEKNDSIYTLDKSIQQNYPKAKLLDNVQDLFTDSTRTTPIHVFGYGLTTDELSQLANQPIIFHPAPIPDGFTAISWTEKVKTGQVFSTQGSYQNTSAKALQLVLKGLNTTLDSVAIPAKATAGFNLKATPKNAGRAVYTLVVLNGKDTLQQERLPVTIAPTHPLKILILSASPDFESKFLKNWLSGNGYGVATRSVISKDKISQDYVNMDQPDLAHLSASLLSKFDVLVGDLSVLKNLNPTESNALQQEVMQKGLGVIIRADSSGKATSWLQSGFPVTYLSGKQMAAAPIHITGKGKTAPLNLDALYINTQNNTQALVTDEHQHELAAATIAGAGKLVFTTVNNSHNWMLAGNKDDYQALWSLLIDKAARRLPVTESWSVTTSLPTINQPVSLMAEQASVPGSIKINQTAVYPAQNPVVPFQQVVTYWPKAYGWQQIIQGNSNPYWWYVWPATDWQGIRAAKKLSLTAQYVQKHTIGTSVTKEIQQKTWVSVPKMYFYILFLMAASFLWAESKFFS
jgi:hypothetical protein